MSMESIFLIVFFFGTILFVMLSIEVGYRLGQIRQSREEKEAPVSAIAAAVLGLLAFILAFTFGIASARFEARKELVRDEANKIRSVWLLSDFLPEPDRSEAKGLIREYLEERVAVAQWRELERLQRAIARAERIQTRLWDIAVKDAQNTPLVAALYVGSLKDMFLVHASRIAVGLEARIPVAIWFALAILTFLGMATVGYQTGIAGSKRTLAMPLLAIAFASVIALIHTLDSPVGGFTIVPQQPLIDLLSSMQTRSGQ
jgi:hypothetical protein